MCYAGASWGPGRCRTASNCCGRSRSSRRSRPPISSASREVAVPRRFAAQQVIFREGDDSDTCYVVRSGHARAVREHPDGRVDHARPLRPGRHLRRAGDVRRRAPLGHASRRSTTLEADRDPRARTCAACCASTPTSRSKLVICARPAAARGQRAPGPPVLPDRPEPRRDRPGRPRRAGPRGGRGRDATCSCAPPRPTSPSSPAPRASPPAASWPCSSAPASSRRAAAGSTSTTRRALARYVY